MVSSGLISTKKQSRSGVRIRLDDTIFGITISQLESDQRAV